jgi:ubiquitin-protein ligase
MTDVNRIKKVRTHGSAGSALCLASPRSPKLSLSQELKDCSKDSETSGLLVELVDQADMLHWKCTIKGPVGTPYEGGIFDVDVQLPSDYPFVPPKVHAQMPAASPPRTLTGPPRGMRGGRR